MSYFLDRLMFFKYNREDFSNGHGVTSSENRKWEDAYRGRWAHDKIVRSTHGVNCTGSCSWKIYVKNGLITWETQQTDYPRTRPDLPNHEPRGCQRGASYSWYIYSANRLKYPMIRKRLLKLWRDAKAQYKDPVHAWASIQADEAKRREYQKVRGQGGFVRAEWEEVNELIAAANIYTIKKHGPDRIIGFSPIPAMSMISYAAGSRYLSLLGGVCMSFYDWYCDLPPSSPQTWGEQTDVPESADWYNAGFIMMWGSNVPQTRTPDAHFMTEVRYKGTQVVTVTPDYSEASKFGDIWLNPKQGTDAAMGMAMGHVILKEFHIDREVDYFDDYCRTYTDMPFLVMLEEKDGQYVPGRMVRASDFTDGMGQANNPDWKTVAIDENTGHVVVPNGSIGFRWGQEGRWNIAPTENIRLQKSFIKGCDAVAPVAFPYFGHIEHQYFNNSRHDAVQIRNVPVRKLKLKGGEVAVATVFDLLCANYGIDRGLGGGNVASSYDDDVPYTPAWQEKITGVPRDQVIRVARAFADNAEKTKGRSMIIIGAAMNHWYHMDMNYRACINMLVFCGCVGQSGGGWSHYVGQEKLRPQTGWAPLAFALDWARPPRQQNSTSFFYAHTDQWRYENLKPANLLAPYADKQRWKGNLIDCNIRAERMGWLPSAPQLQRNTLLIAGEAEAQAKDPVAYAVESLKNGSLRLSCEDPDHPDNWPRNMFVWRSNILGSSGKGHEYFLKHLLGTQNGVQGKDLGAEGAKDSTEVVWHDKAPEGKLDLLVTLDFRMSTTCLYSDVVLPTASWYEKNDLNTSDMHPFIHPLSQAIAPVWQSRTDWDIYKGLAKAFSAIVPGHLGVEKDLVLAPIQHDSPGELAQPLDVKDWKRGECEPVPGVTMPSMKVVERDYPNIYKRYTSLGPLMEKIGNGGKGIAWNTQHEVDFLKKLNGVRDGLAKIETDIDACEVVLSLAPETNGEVAVKSWEALEKITGREHAHLALPKEDEKIRFRDIQAQPRKIISSPTWSGIESEHVSYNAGYTNVHEYIPWRTLTGRQELYQDHQWMRDFGESMVVYKPPINTNTVMSMLTGRDNGHKPIALNFITPHQKWGIHSTYTDNLHMLTLSRGGPIVWISEVDAGKVGIKDNDWIEVFNTNGALVARAVVSQRVNEGMVLMYHAQEKIVNVPGSEITGARGGIHNSVTRATVKPTHMIGGYAQLAYGFNYYGTVGSNRDEFVVVRKMAKVDWMDGEAAE
ncbi:MAG: nitrate reductase subunit alpha [Micavibrio aeruginosavorus]|uniref:nitrate reductase (quinone) n=1 Tax=Micavibrio aeruginosavorus TaxID=349221 RepID=A0A7T5R4B1_9BACT|nr:MAG: nitrate reductase subunit alpha [Micavibrio aeruginosavorus]